MVNNVTCNFYLVLTTIVCICINTLSQYQKGDVHTSVPGYNTGAGA